MEGKNKKREPLRDKKKIQEGRQEYQNIKNYAKRYVTSPGFNQRFQRKMGKLNADSWFSPWSYTINPNYLDKTVFSLLAGDGSSWANADTNTLNMTEKGLFRQTMAHEMGHLLDRGIISLYKRSPTLLHPFNKEVIQYSSIYPELRQNKQTRAAIKNGVRPNSYMTKAENDALYGKYKGVSYDKGNSSYHDAFEQEPYADFFLMRYALDKLNLYDSTKANNPFTKGILQKFKKITNRGKGTKGYHYNMSIKRIFDNFNDDQIIKIMNTVAETDPSKQLNDQTILDPNQTYYAKKGTRLIKKPKNNDQI